MGNFFREFSENGFCGFEIPLISVNGDHGIINFETCIFFQEFNFQFKNLSSSP
jgi:hypothetical protein